MSKFVRKGAWFTVGGVVYYPDYIENPNSHKGAIEHEKVHVRQQTESWMPAWLWVAVYLFLPLPVLFAYARWRWEREAYLVDIRAGMSPAWAAFILWKYYWWPWPKSWMQRWFEENSCRKEEVDDGT